MTELVVKMAGIPVRIQTEYPIIKDFFKEYISEENPLFSVKTCFEDLKRAEEALHRLDEDEGRCYREYEEIELERNALHELIAENMPEHNAFLFHASAISYKGDGILFAAVSGTGKSTHAGYWIDNVEGTSYINDDKPFIRIENDKAYVYGSPWMGKHNRGTNDFTEIKSICILERDERTSTKEVNPMEVYPLIIQQTYRPKDPKKLEKTLSLVDDMVKSTKCYILKCEKNPKAAIVARDGIYENK